MQRIVPLALLAGCATTGVVDKGLAPALTTAQALEQTLAPRRRAILIGVDRYDDPSFPALHHAVDDAHALGESLARAQGGGFEQVQVLDGPNETTREAIFTALVQAREELRREDLLVVYFSGHGTRAWDGTRWHRYLLARDSRAADLDGTAIDLDVLQDFLPLLAPERKALIVDACFQGDGKSAVQPTERGLTEEAVASFVARPTAMSAGEARLFATTPGRPAREDDELGHGVYTYYLLEALSWAFGEADQDQDGVVTAWEAHDYARGRTMTRTDGAQVPEASIRVVGEADLVLAGDPARRQARDRALVYLYPGTADPLHGARLLVDGRDRGVLPGTIPVPSGRHHVTVLSAAGERVAEGYVSLKGGQSLRADDLTRLVRGPQTAVTLHAAGLSSPAFSGPLGPGAAGLGVSWSRRATEGSWRGFVLGVAADGALAPARRRPDGTLWVAQRPLAQVGGVVGYQDDWRRLRLRAGLGAEVVWVPPSWPAGAPDGPLDPAEHPLQAGWLFGALGPDLGLGWVTRGPLTLRLDWRPHLAWLDVEGDGQPGPVLWNGLTLGVELAR